MDKVQSNSRDHAVHLQAEPISEAPTKASQDEHALSVRDFMRILRRRLWVILLVAAVLTGSAVGFSLLQTPTYEGSIKILIRQQQDNAQSTQPNLGSDVLGLQQITATMAEAVHTRPVAKAVIREMDLGLSPEEFLENLSVEQIEDTEFIDVSYKDPSPERAQRIANATGDVFSEQASEVNPSANTITATVWEEAAVPRSPVNPNPVRDGALALLLGSVLGIGLAFLLEHLDDRWRSPEEAARVSGVPNLGSLPKVKANDFPERLVTNQGHAGAAYEAYRTLRTNLIHSLAPPPKAVVLTSPGTWQGKSAVCANLGVVLARAGKGTLIMDCDFREPAIHKFFGLSNTYGMVDALNDERSLQEVWQEPLPGLKVVAVGYISSNPADSVADDLAELLPSNRFAQLLGHSRREFDYVLINVSPTEVVSDPAIVAAQADGVLLVLDPQKSNKTDLRRSVHSLESTGGRVFGTVVNNAKA